MVRRQVAFTEDLDQRLLRLAQEEREDRWLLLQTAYTGSTRRQALYQLPAGARSRIADIGCGFGAAALEMAEHFQAEVEGFDQDRSRLEVARRLSTTFPEIGDRVRFTEKDVTRFLPDHPFDLVTARFVLQYLPSLATLVHWRGWVKPGGSLYLEEVDDGWTVEYPGPPRAWQRIIDAYKAYTHDHGSDREIGRKLPHLLVQAGYHLTRVLWNSKSSLAIEQPSDLQVGFEREKILSLQRALVREGYVSGQEFQAGLTAFDGAYPKMTFLTGATIQIWATLPAESPSGIP